MGAANLLAGLGSGFPVSGGMSQSLVNESAGARTPLSGVFAALTTLPRVVSLTRLFCGAHHASGCRLLPESSARAASTRAGRCRPGGGQRTCPGSCPQDDLAI